MPGKIELLAPAGRWDVLEEVAQAGADAVYIGGKRFNMRLLKSDFNFSDEEIKDAVPYLHAQNKKLYITLNNLYFERETEELKEYLLLLEELKVDALIVQDLSLVKLHQSLDLSIPLHASVQMGIGNSEVVKFLEKLGFARVILSKNLSLEEIKQIKDRTDMDIEFFVHGDMCISHTGQCHMSSFIAGASGNRGRCIKPCRWPYVLDGLEGYYLAHNDLSLFPFVKDLINAKVDSLKVEGRMRDAGYLSSIIGMYRSAIDDIYKKKEDYKVDQAQSNEIEKNRVRNITVANLWGKLDIDAVDITGEREPFFPTKPRKLAQLQSKANESEFTNQKCEELAVKIGNITAFEVAKNYCDTIILGLERFGQDESGFDLTAIKDLLNRYNLQDTKIKIETPRIVTEKNCFDLINIIKDLDEFRKQSNFAGFIVNDLGSLHYLGEVGFAVWGGPGLNITNSKACDVLLKQGVKGLCLSPELKLANLEGINEYKDSLELVVHGPLCGIITDYTIEEYHSKNNMKVNYLWDNFKQGYRLRLDNAGRTHIYYPYDLSLYDYLSEFLNLGFTRMRIDGHFYNNEQLDRLLFIYRRRLKGIESDKEVESTRDELLNLFPQGLTDLSFNRPNV